jgi:pantoate--beta-alanine ligase
MDEFPTISGLRKQLNDLRHGGATIGFVPTMGALHEGHISLARRAAVECDAVVMSIFVNPLQFGQGEDLDRYPRTIERDRELAEGAGVTCLFTPDVHEMYPNGEPLTKVVIGEITKTLEGAMRPGHFNGVATVVAKLFSIVGSSRAYFGEKDWQQLAVVRQIAVDLSIPVTVIGCETVRESDGLALSSRNVYMNMKERSAALCLHRALSGAQKLIDKGETSADVITEFMYETIDAETLATVNYAVAVDDSFNSVSVVDAFTRLLVSANVGNTHLIDNSGVAP